MEKLIKIQSELKAPKNQYNAFGKYKYRNCEDVLEAVKRLLNANSCTLTISDEVKQVGDLIYVEATANFSDGTYNTIVKAQAGIDPNRKGMDISQSFGSSSSYARKYALNGLFLIDDSKDQDNSTMAEKSLIDCENLEELKEAYSSLSPNEQRKCSKLKDELKTKLAK